jgi:hypothetical protein
VFRRFRFLRGGGRFFFLLLGAGGHASDVMAADVSVRMNQMAKEIA